MNVATHQEKEKNEKTVKRKAGEKRPILKRLRATLLRSFRGCTAKKWFAKSELVENREGKSTLYGVICCCDDRLLSRAVICGHTI